MRASQPQRSGEVVEVPAFVRRFIAVAPWRPVRSLKARLEGRDPCPPGAPYGCSHQTELFGAGEAVADPHWYVIRDWREIGEGEYWEFVRVIRSLGYPATYQAPYWERPLVNRYLDIGEFAYWAIPPRQLCRTRLEWMQHRPLSRQGRLDAGSGPGADRARHA